jgi:hypothetical protein
MAVQENAGYRSGFTGLYTKNDEKIESIPRSRYVP